MPKTRAKLSVHQRIKRASIAGRGIKLSPEEVRDLYPGDHAIMFRADDQDMEAEGNDPNLPSRD